MRTSVALALFGLLAATAGFGGNFSRDDKNTIVIYSETTLSGVNPHITTIRDVIQRLGTPDRDPGSQLERRHEIPLSGVYEWQRTGWRLGILVEESWGRLRIAKVEVWGEHPRGDISSTGQGARLGDTINKVRRIYGIRPYLDTGTLEPKGQRLLLFSGGETILAIDVDSAQRVCHMKLQAIPDEPY